MSSHMNLRTIKTGKDACMHFDVFAIMNGEAFMINHDVIADES